MMYFVNKGHKVYSFSFYSQYSQDLPEEITQIHLPIFPLKYNYTKRFIHLKDVYTYVKKFELDILHIISMINSTYAICRNRVKIVLENMGSDVLILPKRYPIYKILYKFMYKFADAVVQDSYISKRAGELYGAPLINNEVIDIGVNFEAFSPNIKFGIARAKLGLSDNEKMVFFSRGLNDIYNLDIIIKTVPIVVKTIPNIKYVFCNLRGDLKFKYDRLIQENKCSDYIISVGRLDHFTEMPYYYRDSDVVLSVPSSDSSPLSVYESMACKTPVIISDLPWFKDKFEKDRDLVIVSVKDIEMLANAIIKVLNGECTVDVDSVYEKVFRNINYKTENLKLENLYTRILKNL